MAKSRYFTKEELREQERVITRILQVGTKAELGKLQRAEDDPN